MAHSPKVVTPNRQPYALPPAPPIEDGLTPPVATEVVFLSRMYALLVQHQADPSLRVSRLAHQLGIDRKTLYRKVQRLTHLTPTELIRQYKLRRAADLLRLGYTIAQTAVLSGFKTPSHFTAVFKEYYRQTPTEFITSQGKRVGHE
ncbi:helix-turn-helix transcriptional regulator [Spirosoma fluviale]|uniref:AraC-type DNA-binding protein n=1 Tax=Spirosoma fluviale TaxID=1597977 RepID=A0A286G3G8_9BACT|nr:helix-turn-helix transcriptional regulator [Spirosoma fluviale]SOD89689.1 AraC-type DNA-binding protein [Spirosoma fluviale]